MKLEGKSVLIIDDSRAMRDILRVHLSNLDISKVRMVERIADALREVSEREFDVILCDYHLSDGRTGQQFLEEIRTRKLVPQSRVFIMVTSEQVYANVMAVAEYAPDDYLIKPFVSTALEKRLLAAFEKKHALRKIFDAMDKDDHAKAFQACQLYLNSGEGKYQRYVERLRAECCLLGENYEHAAHYYEEILKAKPVAWAELGLGKALHHLGEFERATELIAHVCKQHPMYLEGYDSLAKVHEAAGEDEAAEEVVDQAIEKSPLRLDRHAQLGELAIRNGNLDKAEKAFSKIVNEGVGSCFHAPDAYYRLAEVHVAKGDAQAAADVLGKMGGHFEGKPDAEFCAAVAGIGVAKESGDMEKARARFDKARGIREENPDAHYPESVSIRYACEAIELGEYELGKELLRKIVQNHQRPDVVKRSAFGYVQSPEATAKLQLYFEEFDGEIETLNEQSQQLAREQRWDEAVKLATEAVTRLRNNVDVLLSAVQINLMRMDHTGWDEIRFPTVRKYLERARALNSKHPKLSAMEMMIDRTKKKYGVLSERRSYYSPAAEATAPAAEAKVDPKAKIKAQAYSAADDDDEINLDELL